MHESSYYEALKVTLDAPPEVIRAAYKTLSQKYHPDKNPNNPDAERMMSRINAAYSVLSDPDKRRDYDLSLNATMPRERVDEMRDDVSAESHQEPPPLSELLGKVMLMFGVLAMLVVVWIALRF